LGLSWIFLMTELCCHHWHFGCIVCCHSWIFFINNLHCHRHYDCTVAVLMVILPR
jgi:hypothetical protein